MLISRVGVVFLAISSYSVYTQTKRTTVKRTIYIYAYRENIWREKTDGRRTDK